MSERLNSSSKTDYPPKPPREEESFDPQDARSEAREVLAGLKEVMDNQDLRKMDMPLVWNKVQGDEVRAQHAIDAYIAAPPGSIQQTEARKEYRKILAELKGTSTEEFHAAVQDMLIARPKDSGRRPKNTDRSLKALGRQLESYMESEVTEIKEARNARITEIRDRLQTLERQSSVKDVEEEALALEKELRSLEKVEESLPVQSDRDKGRRKRGSGGKGNIPQEEDLDHPVQEEVIDAPQENKPASFEEATVPENNNEHGSGPMHLNDSTPDVPRGPGINSESATPAEARRKLSEILEKHGPKKEGSEKWTVEELREARAREMAERLGITDKREAMLALEDKYRAEIAESRGKFLNFKKKSGVAAEYAKARLEWTQALNGAASSLDGRRRAEAHLIGIRDTALREEQARQKGIEQGMSERAKKPFGQVLSWWKKPLQGYMWATGHVGKGASYVRRLFGRMGNKQYSPEEKQALEQRYTQGVRIASSALIGTALFGGVGTLGFGLSVGFRIGRGALGFLAGTTLGMYAGKQYEKTVGERNRLALWKGKRTEVRTLQDQLEFEKAYQKGNRKARTEARRKVELWTAFATGAGVGIGSGFALSAFGNLEAVQRAAENIQDAGERITQAGGSVAESAGRVEAAGHAISAIHETPGTRASVESIAGTGSVTGEQIAEATIQRGEGFNTLFVELRASGIPGDSAVAQHLMDPSFSPSELSSEVHALLSGDSAVTQPGDRVFVDARGLWFERDGASQLLMENKDGGIVTHALQNVELRPTGVSLEVPGEAPEPAPEVSSGASEVETTAELNRDSLEGVEIEDVPTTAHAEMDVSTTDNEITEVQEPPAPIGQTDVPQQEVPPADPSVETTTTSQETPPVHEEAQIESSSTETEAPRPSYEAPFVNTHGLSIDPRVSGIYANEYGAVTVYGLDFAERFRLAQDYAALHPGTVVHLESSRPVMVDGRMQLWTTRVSMDPATNQMSVDPRPAGPQYVGRPNPQTFTERIPNPS